ncbi:MAG: hypothetical protein KJ630_07450 [Proteobacteria bacterium]|nr:hypothetical protein [Pseudomonadota bacterium]
MKRGNFDFIPDDFTVFNADKVMFYSGRMILTLLAHPDAAKKKISDADLSETIKDLSGFDGGFTVDNAVVLSGNR